MLRFCVPSNIITRRNTNRAIYAQAPTVMTAQEQGRVEQQGSQQREAGTRRGGGGIHVVQSGNMMRSSRVLHVTKAPQDPFWIVRRASAFFTRLTNSGDDVHPCSQETKCQTAVAGAGEARRGGSPKGTGSKSSTRPQRTRVLHEHL